MSELSLVLLSLGRINGEVSEKTMGGAALAFGFMAINSTYAMFKSDRILRAFAPWLARLGLPDLPAGLGQSEIAAPARRIYLLGFSWTASSLLELISRERPNSLAELAVIDFNPQVNERLRRRGVHVVYGDVSQSDVLLHAGITNAELVICSLPNSLLKGSNNFKLLRQVRELNPSTRVIVHAERLDDVARLYAAGASYVLTPRLLEAGHLMEILNAASMICSTKNACSTRKPWLSATRLCPEVDPMEASPRVER